MIGFLALFCLWHSESGLAAETEPSPGGRVEVVLANEYRKDVEVIKLEFVEAGLSNVHFQFMRQGQPPPNIGLGSHVTAARARAVIRLARKYNRGVQILLPQHLFSPTFITIASSNFDDTVEYPVDEQMLANLEDPSLSTEQFHELYRRLTAGPAPNAKPGRKL